MNLFCARVFCRVAVKPSRKELVTCNCRLQHLEHICWRFSAQNSSSHRWYTQQAGSRLKTIYALSSGQGVCGISVIRISGPSSKVVFQDLVQLRKPPPPKILSLRKLYHPGTTEMLDRGMVVWFPGPNSFTGEDCCELHIHGGSAVIKAVLNALSNLPEFVPAEPGEFTKRAFQNGKLDLTEAEGLADLLHAETEVQRQQALRQMEGSLSNLYSRWRQQLLQCTAHVEAFIDFSEEDNIEDGVLDAASELASRVHQEIAAHLADNRKGERLRSGVRITILGEPNVGKSSLLNAICQRPAAIVSPMAGTTRDVVETALNIGGYPVLLSDTAGLRHTTNEVEREGVKRAIDRAAEADLNILTLDMTKLTTSQSGSDGVSLKSLLTSLHQYLAMNTTDINPVAETIVSSAIGDAQTGDIRPLVVLNKCDLLDKDEAESVSAKVGASQHTCCAISCISEEGMDQFLEILADRVKELCANPRTSPPTLTQARHRHHLTQCKEALEEFAELEGSDTVLAADQLRKALWQIGKVTGQVTSHEILDVVFRDFCIGK